MKHSIFVATVIVLSHPLLFASEKEISTPLPRLTVSLTDGSRLIGETTLTSLPLSSEAMGRIDIPLGRIRDVKFSNDHESVTVSLANRDKIQGNIGKMTLPLQTLFGKVTVPIEQIAAINIRNGTQSSVEFDPSKPYGLQFDGRQNYVQIPSDASLDPTEAMTLECWVKTKTEQDLAILGKRQWRDKPDHGYQLHVSSGSLYAYWEGRLIQGNKINDGLWHHAAMTWDGTRRQLFQDGVKTAEDTPGVWTPSAGQFRIGGVDGRDSRDFFDGAISEVRLSKIDRYKGQNFTPPRRFELDKNTVGYWKLAEDSGSVVRDQTSDAHDGVLVGEPAPQWIEQAP